MVDVLPFEDPVIVAVGAAVNVNVFPALGTNAILVLVPLQMAKLVTALVMAGLGFTVTLKVLGIPIQPAVEVGVTI